MANLQPPTPPPRKLSRKATSSFRLPFIGKKDSHERPILVRQSSSTHSCSDLRGSSAENSTEMADRPNSGEPCTMRHIAASLCFAHLPAMAVAGVQPSTDQWKKRRRLGDGSSHIPTHRASYHGNGFSTVFFHIFISLCYYSDTHSSLILYFVTMRMHNFLLLIYFKIIVKVSGRTC